MGLKERGSENGGVLQVVTVGRPEPGWNVYCGVFLISLSVLMLELVLTRIFSVTMYYHFAFMAISLALFGAGASGVFVFLKSWRFTAEKGARHMAIASVAMAVTILLALVVLLRVSVGLVPSGRSYLILAGLYIVCSAPFFFGGLCLSIAMKHQAARSGKLYFFDLAGAGAGCILVVPVLDILGGPSAMLGVALLASAGGLLFSISRPRNRWTSGLTLASAIAFLVLVAANTQLNFLAVIWAKGSREKQTLFAKWNSFSRVTVLGDLSDSRPLWVTIDSDAATPILRYSSNPDAMDYVERAVSALPYEVKDKPKVLVIGPGGGREVVTALEAGSRDITGVEVNPIIVRDVMLVEPYRSFSGNLYARPEVKVVVDEGRSYIRSIDEKFDIIQASLIDTWAASSAGAFSLAENNLYTVEAFKLYLEHLTDDGILTMTRWLLNPPQQELRLVSLAREVMRQAGVPRPERHLCLFKAPGQGERIETCFIFKKSEFTDQEIARLEGHATNNGLDVLYTPLTRPANAFSELATATDLESFYHRYPINVRPTYDNSPFFFYHVTPSDILKAFRLTNESQKTNMGVFVLFNLLIITTVLVGVFVIGPLSIAKRRGNGAGHAKSVIYFGCLGLGFIVIEMVMVQRFILFLGYPVYALAVALFSILFWGSLGSLLTSRIPDDRVPAAARFAIGAVISVTAACVLALPVLIETLGGASIGIRIIVAVVTLLPLALALGMPMPLGIRMLNRTSPSVVPWAWGINGAASVLGSVLSIILAMNLGFDQALAFGCVAYLFALLLVGALSNTRAAEPSPAGVITDGEPALAGARD